MTDFAAHSLLSVARVVQWTLCPVKEGGAKQRVCRRFLPRDLLPHAAAWPSCQLDRQTFDDGDGSRGRHDASKPEARGCEQRFEFMVRAFLAADRHDQHLDVQHLAGDGAGSSGTTISQTNTRPFFGSLSSIRRKMV